MAEINEDEFVLLINTPNFPRVGVTPAVQIAFVVPHHTSITHLHKGTFAAYRSM
jgi:hypothetical protein